MPFSRFIALGDSLTEGLSDRYPSGQYRGWADRVADRLAQEVDGFKYANLAVRGKLVEEVATQQLPRALELIDSQSLVSFHAGANNILRPKLDLSFVFNQYKTAISKLAQTKAKLIVFTVREIDRPQTPIEILWNKRFGPFNENVHKVAQQFGATVMDANSHEVFGAAQMLAADRLHLSSEGHRRVANAVLAQLGYPHETDWLDPFPPRATMPLPLRLLENAVWTVGYVGPWLVRRATGKSSGDGRTAKYPDLIDWQPKEVSKN